ncbi:MAG: hypothetical protein CMM47_03820 [Rhodospirillaceae bacterium]|nr:hypothetical protein [Rhodospirillaceae bacterium]
MSDSSTPFPDFDVFLGIDWSGARGPKLPGLQIAEAKPGNAAPGLVDPPVGRWWTRRVVLEWLIDRMARGRVLAGFDFAFAYAFGDEGAYFPGEGSQPDHAFALWDMIEGVCEVAPELYGAPFYQRDDLPWHRYFLSPRGKGDLYRFRQRKVETACAAITAPHPVMKCVGSANVGTGSLAGMRFLHHLKSRLGDDVTIWPFEAFGGGSVVVEIFPRLFFKLARANPRAWTDQTVLNRALAHYGSRPVAADWVPAREDEPDALVSAAALRALDPVPEVWQTPFCDRVATRAEGWIFGVDWSS